MRISMLKDELAKHIKPGDNLVNLGRTLKSNYSRLWQEVIDNTAFLPQDCKFNERVYCIMNGLTARPKCPIKGKELRFINYFKGYPRTAGGFNFQEIKTVEGPITYEEIEYLRNNHTEFAEATANAFFLDNLDLVGRVKWNTSFLDPEITFAERAYCVVHGITSKPKTCFFTFERGYAAEPAKDYTDLFLQLAAKVGSNDKEHGRKIWRNIQDERNEALEKLPESEINKLFVTCPIFGTRKENIKEPYINNILLMTMAEFKTRFPNQLLTCEGHSQSISEGVTRIGDNGLRPADIAAAKARVTLSTPDEDGLTGDQKRGLKIQKTGLELVDENGFNMWRQTAMFARNKQIETMIARGDMEDNERTEWGVYKWFVHWWAAQYDQELIGDKKIGRDSGDEIYSVDHIYSVTDAFYNNVSPFVVSHRKNLQLILTSENRAKAASSKITLAELLNITETTASRNAAEFAAIMAIIKDALAGDIRITSPRILDLYNKTGKFDARIYTKPPVRNTR
jgi:hypothetical protein